MSIKERELSKSKFKSFFKNAKNAAGNERKSKTIRIVKKYSNLDLHELNTESNLVVPSIECFKNGD